ncbi:unnamed protein product [Musa acuminata subsp. malaccensis]|uniref:(wild Malaysian banana) hypothetical protein n=1 Tax=Musa acuminata subsp. malaccensis TaxID=214687 RepID=A0A804IC54_MUSAM|nr:unnamed protein product [Musa acuminata subsp. malaccensis]
MYFNNIYNIVIKYYVIRYILGPSYITIDATLRYNQISKRSTPTCRASNSTKTSLGMSRPGKLGMVPMASFRTSRDDSRTKVPSHPSRIGYHTKPAYDRLSYSSIKAPS